MSDYTPIVDAILKALPDIAEKVPEGMTAGLKFTSPTQTTHGGFPWPNPGEWTPEVSEDDFNPETCTSGGYHAALTIVAAGSGGHRYTHAMLVAWYPDEAGQPDEDGKVKARRILSVARIDIAACVRTGALSGADLNR